jgi:uncharacterized protein (DUF427 family)
MSPRRTREDAVKIPGIEHPITIEPSSERVTVRAAGRVVADTKSALVLREAKLAPVFYIPLDDVDESAIASSVSHTYCPYKGEASYYDVVTDEGRITDAIWTYPEPYDAVAEIRGHVAFYPSRVEITTG